MPSSIPHPSSSPILIAGPTASGKSAVALEIAQRVGGEIISVDSMQVYRGLDLGTAKPTPAERARVPHHLVDVVDLADSFDAATFLRLAGEAATQITSRGRVPVFCGGTGLYFKAWIEGLAGAPAPDPVLRAELEVTPREELLRELEQRDPAAFARIDRKNPRRVVRAVEVVRLTGRPVAIGRGRGPHWSHPSPIPVLCLRRAAPDLRARIHARVDSMFARGLVAETESLLAKGLAQNRTAMQALGYRQVVEHLHGAADLAATVAMVKTRTWQFARRQMSWFRNQLDVEWLEVGEAEPAESVAGRVLAAAGPAG